MAIIRHHRLKYTNCQHLICYILLITNLFQFIKTVPVVTITETHQTSQHHVPVIPDSETDGDNSRKVLGSSVVTSVSVIMETNNGSHKYFADAAGRPVARPTTSSQLASPVTLINPDRYEFYTFNDHGELIKHVMTLEEIQKIIAAGGEGDSTNTFTRPEEYQIKNSETRVHDVVANVQSVLKEEIAALNKAQPGNKPAYANVPEFSSSWLGSVEDLQDIGLIPDFADIVTGPITTQKPKTTTSSTTPLIRTKRTTTERIPSSTSPIVTTKETSTPKYVSDDTIAKEKATTTESATTPKHLSSSISTEKIPEEKTSAIATTESASTPKLIPSSTSTERIPEEKTTATESASTLKHLLASTSTQPTTVESASTPKHIPSSTSTEKIPEEKTTTTESASTLKHIPSSTSTEKIPEEKTTITESASTLKHVPSSTSTETIPEDKATTTESTTTSKLIPSSTSTETIPKDTATTTESTTSKLIPSSTSTETIPKTTTTAENTLPSALLKTTDKTIKPIDHLPLKLPITTVKIPNPTTETIETTTTPPAVAADVNVLTTTTQTPTDDDTSSEMVGTTTLGADITHITHKSHTDILHDVNEKVTTTEETADIDDEDENDENTTLKKKHWETTTVSEKKKVTNVTKSKVSVNNTLVNINLSTMDKIHELTTAIINLMSEETKLEQSLREGIKTTPITTTEDTSSTIEEEQKVITKHVVTEEDSVTTEEQPQSDTVTDDNDIIISTIDVDPTTESSSSTLNETSTVESQTVAKKVPTTTEQDLTTLTTTSTKLVTWIPDLSPTTQEKVLTKTNFETTPTPQVNDTTSSEYHTPPENTTNNTYIQIASSNDNIRSTTPSTIETTETTDHVNSHLPDTIQTIIQQATENVTTEITTPSNEAPDLQNAQTSISNLLNAKKPDHLTMNNFTTQTATVASILVDQVALTSTQEHRHENSTEIQEITTATESPTTAESSYIVSTTESEKIVPVNSEATQTTFETERNDESISTITTNPPEINPELTQNTDLEKNVIKKAIPPTSLEDINCKTTSDNETDTKTACMPEGETPLDIKISAKSDEIELVPEDTTTGIVDNKTTVPPKVLFSVYGEENGTNTVQTTIQETTTTSENLHSKFTTKSDQTIEKEITEIEKHLTTLSSEILTNTELLKKYVTEKITLATKQVELKRPILDESSVTTETIHSNADTLKHYVTEKLGLATKMTKLKLPITTHHPITSSKYPFRTPETVTTSVDSVELTDAPTTSTTERSQSTSTVQSSWKLVPIITPHQDQPEENKFKTNKPDVKPLKSGIFGFQRPSIHQRPPPVAPPTPTPYTSSVSLNPTPPENIGLEATTVNLNEDINEFVKLCNELAFKIWNSVTAKGVSSFRSVFISPFAATSMLAMIFLGARGPTSGEMNDILKLDDMFTFNPHLIFRNVSMSIEMSRKSGVAESIIIRELFSDRTKGKLLEFYKERARQFYDGHVEEVNFKIIGNIVKHRTNLLIRRQTQDKILDFIRGNQFTLRPPLAAFTANIFETDCSLGSSEGRDGEIHFIISPNTRQRRLIPIPAVVYRSGFLAGYEPELDATAVALGHDQTVSVVYVIPGQHGNTAPGDGLIRLEKHLSEASFKSNAWSKLLRTLSPHPNLELQIPRFSHRSVINTTQALQRMGLRELFNPRRADLRGLNGNKKDGLHLSDMIQMNNFTQCGENIVTDFTHHMETYPAVPNRLSKIFDNEPPRDNIDFSSSDILDDGIRDSKYLEYADEPRDYQRAFHDPFHNPRVMELPLALRPRQARIPDTPRLRLDRPFLYFVRHNPTGLILHMGRFNPRLLP